MKCLQIIAFCLGAGIFSSQAQTRDCSFEYDSSLQMRVYTYVDQMPEYITGETGMIKFFTKHFQYPEKQEQIQGSINLVFVIMEDGRIKGEGILHKKPKEWTLADKEALRVIRKMPLWKAGICRGKKVPVKFSWPVRF